MRVESDTLLLADLFENFTNICLKIYQLDATRFFFPAPGLAWQAALKENPMKLDMVEKAIKGGMCQSIY